MSRTFSLICEHTKTKLWIGQGGDDMQNFYSGEPTVMSKLGRFLSQTMGFPLLLVCNDRNCEILEQYEEFEAPDNEQD